VPEPEPTSSEPGERGRRGSLVHPVVATLGAYSWRLIAIGIVGWALLELITVLWVLLLAGAVAVLLSRALDPVANVLRRLRWPNALVALTTLLGFLLALAGIVSLLVPSIVDEFSDLGPTLEDAVDDLEDWLVDDSPFDIERGDIDDFRDQARDWVSDNAQSQTGTVVSGTVIAVEVLTGLFLSLITTFFILKDGHRFNRWVLGFVPDHRQTLAVKVAARSWQTLGGYLRGSATLGVIEGIIIGTTVWLVGGKLAIPVAVVTFFAAFVPFAGAVLAGAIAVLVTLVTAGTGQALIVLAVAVAVQQLDNDLLAPVVFGKNLELHALVVLGAIVAGSTLFGPFGAVLAVPVTAVIINVLAEIRADGREAVEEEDDLSPEVEDGISP
jgi:predicted PurR-regulated permease PerM